MSATQLALLSQIALPANCHLPLTDFTITADTLELSVSNQDAAASCTNYHVLAQRIHSRYQRKLDDLPYLIRVVRLFQGQAMQAPRVLGIDDWAWRKRYTYGTILVDLERMRVVDLLPDRQPETIARWLRDHPGVEIISRDRGQEYIEGVNQGLPGVKQVADRFHLLRHLLDALQRMLECRPGEVKAASRQVQSTLLASSPSPSAPIEAIPTAKPHRQLKFEEVKALQTQGLTRRETAHRVGVDRRTVGKYFCLDAPPSRKGMTGRMSTATPYYAHLHKRLGDSCRNIKELYEELCKMGFGGSYSAVFRAVHRFGIGDLERSEQRPAPSPRFSPKQAAMNRAVSFMA
jgi:hypothetical protein